MTKQLELVLKGLTKEQWEDITSGHDEYKASFYLDMGFPEDFVNRFVKVTKSDGTYMGSLWKDPFKASVILGELARIPKGEPIPKELEERFSEQYIPEAKGVYSLDFLRGLERALKVKSESCLGRGRQARYIVTAIQKKLGLELTCPY